MWTDGTVVNRFFQFASKTLPAVSSVLAELHLYIYHLLYMCFRVMLA